MIQVKAELFDMRVATENVLSFRLIILKLIKPFVRMILLTLLRRLRVIKLSLYLQRISSEAGFLP